MEVKLNVRRLNPDVERPAPYFQEYDLDLDETSTLLDGLIEIREQIDGTLALRCSCRSAICGSCTVRVNGHAALACNTKIVDEMPKDGSPICFTLSKATWTWRRWNALWMKMKDVFL